MRIWLIQTGEDVPFGKNLRKLRTAILAEEMESREHEVVWWAAAFSHLRKEWVTRDRSKTLSNGVKVELLHGRGYQKNISLARILDHRLIARDFKKRCKDLPVPDVIVCALPPYDLAYQAARYANRLKIPFVVDARDYWPDIFLTAIPKLLKPLAKLILVNEFRQTRFAIRSAGAITAMSEDMLAWAYSYCDRKKRPHGRVFYLGFRSAPPIEAASPDWLTKLDGRFVIIFVGTFSRFHSPAIMVQVAERLLSAGREDIAIVIAGAGGDLFEEITEAARKMPNIILTGWLEQDAISALLSRANVGICPTSVDARFFPNKAFLYFSRGLPVLSAFEGELRRLLENKGLGNYFHFDDDEELTGQIIRFCDDSDLYRNTCRRVRKVFSERFDEQVIYSEFADYIEKHVNKGAIGQWGG